MRVWSLRVFIAVIALAALWPPGAAQGGVTERVSVSPTGEQGNSGTYETSISADGRFVAFCSHASNLVPGDTNGYCDVFVRDRLTGATERVSVCSTGEQSKSTIPSDEHPSPCISADGRYVAFDARAYNLVPADTNGVYDAFVRDRWALAEAKKQPEGEPVMASAYTVTASFPGFFYIQEANRSCGIKVVSDAPVVEGKRVRVDGTTRAVAGERCIQAGAVRLVDELPLKPLCLTNPALGGGIFGLQTPVWSWRWARRPGGDPEYLWLPAEGLNNVGLLVRTCGRVTQLGPDYLYINDGSGLKDGTLTGEEENVGVRVVCDPTGYASGNFLIVTSISSCFETPSGQLARRILTRRATDIQKIVGP